MIKILLNPKKFKDYNEETGKSELANETLFIIGPSSVTVEKAMVPYNSGKWGERNQRVLAKHNCRGGTLPLWATVEGMWFEDTEFELVAASSAYPDLIMSVSAGRIIVEKDGEPMTVEELWKLAKGGDDVPYLKNIMPTTGVKVVDENGYIGGDFLGSFFPVSYYNNFAIVFPGADYSDMGLGTVTFVDNTTTIGGRVYKTVTIGGVTWLAENLDYKFSGCGIGGSGTPSTPNAWYYNNDETSYGIDGTRKCGLLYNWYAVKLLNDNRADLIPGWHVPTNEEWSALANAVGGTSIAGTRLKALDGAADESWPANWNGTDDFGFGILPAGNYLGSFRSVGSNAYFWTSTAAFNPYAYYWNFATGSSMSSNDGGRNSGRSVRLVKDSKKIIPD